MVAGRWSRRFDAAEHLRRRTARRICKSARHRAIDIRRDGENPRALFRKLRHRRRTAEVQGYHGAAKGDRCGLTNRAQANGVIPNEVNALSLAHTSTPTYEQIHLAFERSFGSLRMTVTTWSCRRKQRWRGLYPLRCAKRGPRACRRTCLRRPQGGGYRLAA